MRIEAKIENPICIRFGDSENIVLADENTKDNYSLIPGVMFGDSHYGFVLIIDVKGRQKEIVYPTQCKIDAVGVESGLLKIYESGKNSSWIFDKKGELKKSIFNDFTDEYRNKYDIILKNPGMFTGNHPMLKNPLSVRIAKDPNKSVILADDSVGQDYPLYPGAMMDNEHYGFILLIDTKNGLKKVVYPTQNRIEALGIDGNCYRNLKIFEEGKYHPWVFTYRGEFMEASSYNPFSKRDKAFINEVYDLDIDEANDHFKLKMKK